MCTSCVALSVPSADTSSASRSSLKAFPVIENAAMRLRQSSGFQGSGLKPVHWNSIGKPGPFGCERVAIKALMPSVKASRTALDHDFRTSTRASASAKLLAASVSEMWITRSAMVRLYR